MRFSVRPGSMTPLQFALSLTDEEREAYKFVELMKQAIEMACMVRKVLPRMNHEQFERVVVYAAKLFGHQSPLVKYDDMGNCPAVTMVLTHHSLLAKNTNVNLNSLNKDFTFVRVFPARDRLMECVKWSLDATDYGKGPPKE